MSATVLVVEDHWLLLDEVAHLLEQEGYHVLKAGHGLRALDLVSQHHPDLILSDWQMPQTEVDGLELLRRLRIRGDDTYFILMTARPEVEDRVIGLDMGANDFLVKPFDTRELVARVAVGIRSIATLHRTTTHLEQTLHEATQAQMALLPPRSRTLRGARYDYRFSPCDFVSGDGLNVSQLDDETILFYLFDVSGHGVPAVMMATTLQRLIPSPRFLQTLSTPLTLVEALNDEFAWSRTGRLITMFVGQLNVVSGVLRYVRAGHPAPWLLRANGNTEALNAEGILVGLDATLVTDTFQCRRLPSELWTEASIHMRPGDCILLYSDALIEARSRSGIPLPVADVVEALTRCQPRTPELLLEAVERVVDGYRTDGLRDDLSLLALEYLGTPAGETCKTAPATVL